MASRRTKSNGSFSTTDSYRSKAQHRYRWTSPTGKRTSPPVRPYSS